MLSSSFPGTHIKVETGERSNHLSVRDLVPARCFYKSMHLIPQINRKKIFEINPMSLSIWICNHFKITILIPPFLTHFKSFEIPHSGNHARTWKPGESPRKD